MTCQSDALGYRDPEWVAAKLGVDKNTVYKYLQDGVIPAIQLGRKWLISEARLVEWLETETERQTMSRRTAAASAGRTASRMDNLTPHAQQAVRQAHAEARRYGHAYLGQEHLLLGIIGVEGCAGVRVLAQLGVTPDHIREQFESSFAPGESPVPRRLARTPRAKKAMRLAGREAARAGRRQAGTEHLLLALSAAGEGAGHKFLTGLGVTADGVRRAIKTVAPPEDDRP